MRPVTSQPGYSEADLETLLASGQFVFADCFTITLNNGIDKLRYTTAQHSVSVVPVGDPMRVTYRADLVLIEGLRFSVGIGTEVDEQQITLSYAENHTVQGQSFALALRLGWFDGAVITRDRFFAASWGSPWVGGIPMFAGKISTLDSVGRMRATLKVRSALVLLNLDMPRNVWQPSCKNNLYDLGCGVDPNLHSTTVLMAVDGTTTVLPWPAATADYLLGKVYIENFDGVARVRAIKSVQAGVSVTLSYPLDFVPVSGNQFVAYEGCERTQAVCPRFDVVSGDWVDRFRAYPYVPVGEAAV